MTVFEFEGEIENEGESPNPSDESPQDEGKSPETEKPQPPADDSRIAGLERQLGDIQSKLLDVVAENATLKTKQKKAESEERKLYSAEELKKFGLEDEGKKQFDAAKLYTDQAIAEATTQVRSELDAETSQKAVVQEMLSIYPELSDPNSEFSRRVENEKLSVLRRGLAEDDNSAFNIALHKVSRVHPRANGDGETGDEYARRRRMEASGGEGSPKGGTSPDDHGDRKLTKSELSEGRRMGLNMDDKKVRARLLERLKRYESRRTR